MKNKDIVLTEKALEKALELRNDYKNYQGKSLRLYLDGKGCDGFYYGVCFDYPSKQDLHFKHADLDLVVDPDSFEFCYGSTITWVDDQRGQGFLVENPNQAYYRGKFFKKKAWQDKLSQKKQHSDQKPLNS